MKNKKIIAISIIGILVVIVISTIFIVVTLKRIKAKDIEVDLNHSGLDFISIIERTWLTYGLEYEEYTGNNTCAVSNEMIICSSGLKVKNTFESNGIAKKGIIDEISGTFEINDSTVISADLTFPQISDDKFIYSYENGTTNHTIKKRY